MVGKISSEIQYPIICRLKLSTGQSSWEDTVKFNATVAPISRWKVSLLNAELFIEEKQQLAHFKVRINNLGNITEQLTLKLDPNNDNLTVPVGISSLLLKPACDTILTYQIILPKHLEELQEDNQILMYVKDQKKNTQVVYQKIFSFKTTLKDHPFPWYTVPLSIEYSTQDPNTAGGQYFVNTTGRIDLSRDSRAMTFRYRTNNYFLRTNQLLSNNQILNINYESPKFKIATGDLFESYNGLLQGVGTKIVYKDSVMNIETMAMKNKWINRYDVGLRHLFRINQKNRFSGNTLWTLDTNQSYRSFYYMGTYEHNFSSSHLIKIGSGLGSQQFNLHSLQQDVIGLSGDVQHEYRNVYFSEKVTGTYFSPNFPGLNSGVVRVTSECQYTLKHSYFGGYARMEKHNPPYRGPNTTANIQNTNQEYGLRLGLNHKIITFTLIPSLSIYQQKIDSLSINSQTPRLSVNTTFQYAPEHNLSLLLAAGQTNGTGINTFVPAFNLQGTWTYHIFELLFQYDKGPANYVEVKDYVVNGIHIERLRISPSVRMTFFKEILSINLQGNYAYNAGIPQPHSLLLRGDMKIAMLPKGFSFSINITHNALIASSEPTNIFATIKKNIFAPIIGVRRYQNLKLILYKDLNSNQKLDNNEQTIADALTMVGARYFVTNKKGEINYKNIPENDYNIDISQANKIAGWVSQSAVKQVVHAKENTVVYIPFVLSRSIVGRVNLQKDRLSNSNFDVAKIRIVAISKTTAREYTTLTDEEGKFFLNLPEDDYILSINKEVFGDNYTIAQSEFHLSLIGRASKQEIIFEVQEKKRIIRIKKD